MDTRTGRVAPVAAGKGPPRALVREATGVAEMYVRPVDPRQLSKTARRTLLRTGTAWVSRNSRCPCGSGRRFKRCCMVGAE